MTDNVDRTLTKHWQRVKAENTARRKCPSELAFIFDASPRPAWQEVGSMHLAPTSTVWPIDLPSDCEPPDYVEVVETMEREG